MANKSTTIPIKLAVNRARPESIRKITQSYRVFFPLLATFHEICRGSRTNDRSINCELDSTIQRTFVSSRSKRPIRSIRCVFMDGERNEEVSKKLRWSEMRRVNFRWDLFWNEFRKEKQKRLEGILLKLNIINLRNF